MAGDFVVKFIKIIIAVLIPNLGGYVFSRGAFKNMDWYRSLKQPKFNPPRWVFGPAWTTIYCCIGFASYLVYEDLRATGNGFDKTALTSTVLFAIQMISNWIWTSIFFRYHSLLWSTVDIITTLISATMCGYVFGKINRIAGFLFIPYIAWLCYATYLNVSVFILNKDRTFEPITASATE